MAGHALNALLLHNPSLTTLNLSWNAISSCFTCRTLTKLDLSWNAFGQPEALRALALALSDKEREREGRHGHGEQASISQTGDAAPEAALIDLRF